MKTFKVKIRGSNYLLAIDGEPHKMGFTTIRYIRATDSAEAEKAVRWQITCEPKLGQESLNGKLDPPRIEIESIERSWLSHLFVRHPKGLAFFSEDND